MDRRDNIASLLPPLLKGRIARGAAGTLGLRVFHAGARFLIALAFARTLGAAGFGAYSFAITWIGVLSVPAILGFEGLLVREVAGYQSGERWGLLNGLILRSRQFALGGSVCTVVAAAVLAWLFEGDLEEQMATAFSIGLLALPLVALVRVTQAALMGLHRVVPAQIPETVIQPCLLAIFFGIALVLPGVGVQAPLVVGLFGTAMLVALLVSTALWHALQPPDIKRAKPEFATPEWLRSARTFTLISGIGVLGPSLGVIMLGSMAGAEATGIFGVASSAAALIALPLLAINAPLAPTISRIFTEGKREELQGLATKAARSALLLSLPVALVFIGLGHWVLLLFGAEFTDGYGVLVILSLAQVINAGMGSVGVLLQMTGHERDVARSLAIAVSFNVLANLFLIPLWGVNGAAVGAAGNLVIWNVLMAVTVHRKLGIRPTAAG
ncbi:MAG: oligosaccharide flippase family protein [Candidatus Glassbacteria bacterium]|nr:oligosaccharide flippase family protein [Candidatus Glassbacteria bacterium]